MIDLCVKRINKFWLQSLLPSCSQAILLADRTMLVNTTIGQQHPSSARRARVLQAETLLDRTDQTLHSTRLPSGSALKATIAASGRDVLVSFPWYLNANATAGPSFRALYLQDVVSNKTCSYINNTLKCTCYGRRGDVEASCYDVSSKPDLLEHVQGGEAALWGENVDGSTVTGAAFMASAVQSGCGRHAQP